MLLQDKRLQFCGRTSRNMNSSFHALTSWISESQTQLCFGTSFLVPAVYTNLPFLPSSLRSTDTFPFAAHKLLPLPHSFSKNHGQLEVRTISCPHISEGPGRGRKKVSPLSYQWDTSGTYTLWLISTPLGLWVQSRKTRSLQALSFSFMKCVNLVQLG